MIMDNQEGTKFLFAIATEIKRSFETPVILVTKKDYAESIYLSLIDMRSALLQKAPAQNVADLISGFHLEWLQAVQEIECFHKRIRDTPRDHITNAINFSIECANKRVKQFQKYIEQVRPTIPAKHIQILKADHEIILDMHDNLISSLHNKQKTFDSMVDSIDYYNKVLDETEELLNWLDTLNDNLALQFSKVTCLKFPGLATDLTKTLNQIIEEVAISTEPETQQIAKELELKSKILSVTVRHTEDDLEIRKIIEKIKILEERIERLKNEDSSAVIALQHKTLYLEERLMSLENLKETMVALKNKSKVDHAEGKVRIFNHLLPSQKRRLLVEDLVKLWNKSLTNDNQDKKSIISILSVADMREVFSDEYGKFTLDKYGRKLYIGDDNNTYQLNERNELVPLEDDEEHIYFYDHCGRYYYNNKHKRIYKAHETASEYCIFREGLLLKHKEYRDGKEYCYDRLGRYFLNDEGKRIYCDEDGEIYENDGLGNLVRIRSVDDEFNYEMVCPAEPIATESSKYLQLTVGAALKKCIAQVVLSQPPDPVLFLAKSLEHFSQSQQARQQRLADDQNLMAEREERMRDAYQAPTAPATIYSGGDQEEDSYADHNFDNYATMLSEN